MCDCASYDNGLCGYYGVEVSALTYGCDREGYMLTKQCAKCKRTVPFGIRHCANCAPIAEQEQAENKAKRGRQYDKARDPKYKIFYDSIEWRTLRAVKLQESGYICERCKAEGITTLAEDVHHIVPLGVDWDLRLTKPNLICLCVSHHNEAHDRFGRFKKKETDTPRGVKKV